MKLHGSARDLFSHMELLGFAAITSSYIGGEKAGSFSPVTVWWENPDTMVLSSMERDISLEEVAQCVRAYLDDLTRNGEAIRRKIKVGGSARSPLSPRVGELKDSEWHSYQRTRQEIIDRVECKMPLFANLANAIGFPAYWSKTLEGTKGKQKPDMGASLWEMTPRNKGSEFMTNKYLKHVGTCERERFSDSDIAAHICGDKFSVKKGEIRNASGLHAPAYFDVLLSFAALTGICLFPTRAITVGKTGSVSVAATTQRVNGGERTYFVLPIVKHAVTLEKYKGICRNAAVYRIANAAIQDSRASASDALLGSSIGWLRSHDVGHVAVFYRCKVGTEECPEYYACEGDIFPV